MSIAPTLHCPCEGRFLSSAFEYTSPPAGETAFDLGGQPYRRRYDRCTICGHWFGRHDLNLSKLYDHQYARDTYGGAEGMRRRFQSIMSLPPDRSDNRQRVARILDFFARRRGFNTRSDHPRLLDVGAGLGVFPAAMVEAGWQVVALETDLETVEHLRAVVGIEAYLMDISKADEAVVGSFDLITFNKVLEHVEDPVSLLAAAGRLLNPGGFVYVEVPDAAAAQAGAGREEFFVEHHHVFSPASLAMMGERGNLSPCVADRLHEISGKFTLFSFFCVRS